MASHVQLILTLTAGLAAALLFGLIEVALAMAERLLAQLGATGEQLDNARQRVRDELVPQRSG